MTEILNPGSVTYDPSFPHAPDDWTRASAEAVASEEGIELGEDHWTVIRLLQNYFSTNSRPNVREMHDSLDWAFQTAGGIKYVYALLPQGPIAQGCRLAGLQAPSGAQSDAFGSVQ